MKKYIFLAAGCLFLLACNNQPAEPAKTETPAAADTKPDAPKDLEFADSKYMEIGKASLAALSKGDVAGFVGNYADNAVYSYSSGDSLAGLAAITKYWTERRTNVIDSLNYANDIWIPIKVNKPQKGPDQPGVWLLGWFQFSTKYKNGKKVSGWIHNDLHFNDAGKIDRSIMYIDRAPINKALGIK